MRAIFGAVGIEGGDRTGPLTLPESAAQQAGVLAPEAETKLSKERQLLQRATGRRALRITAAVR